MSDAPEHAMSKASRNAGMDALRGAVTLLVVLHHTAIIYGAQGGWYYYEVPHSDRLSSLLLTFFCAANQAWFMGLFFLLAGYFTPPALARKGASAFAADRVVRLGLPIIGYALLLHPLTVAIAQTAKGRPFLEALTGAWRALNFGLGPLWFALALLVFSGAWIIAGRSLNALRAFPSNGALLAAALLTGAAAFVLRLVWPVGVSVFGQQFGYFASYIVLFVAGCLAANARLLEAIPPDQSRIWRRIALVVLPVLPIIAFAPGPLGLSPGKFEGGWTLGALTYAFWEPFVAWGVILSLLVYFQRRFATLDPGWTLLVRRAFAIYVIHPPILTAVAVAWRDVGAPPLLKFGATGAVACLLCFFAAGLLLRVPGVNRVL